MEALNALNFRDVGGVPVRGGTLRRGVLYRSEGPASFAGAHRAELAALGFRLICDLRSAGERDVAPNDWAGAARLLNADVAADLRARTNSAWTLLRANPTPAGARDAMIWNYGEMPSALRPHLAAVVDALADGETPMLIHCTAGKDRTGVLVALLLRLLGASDEAILQDYLLSEAYGRRRGSADRIGGRLAATFGIAPDEAFLAPILGVDPAYMSAAFDAVAAGWGSVQALFEAAGVDAVRQAALYSAVVQPR